MSQALERRYRSHEVYKMYTARNLEDALSAPEETAELLLVGQGLTDFPLEILQLPNLQILDLSQNLLRSIPVEIQALTNLKQLKLRSNQLRKLPEEVGNLQHLSRLDCAGNQMATLPENLRQAPALVEILIGNNSFQQFPLRALPPCLNSLVISENGIHTLPGAIRHLFELQYLDLRHNNLSILPDSLTLLKQLDRLLLSGNPIHLATDFSDPEEQLVHFFKDFRKHTSNLDEARAWFRILQGQADLLQDYSLALLLSALNCPLKSVRETAREHLPTILESPFAAKGEATFFLAGQFSLFRKGEATKALEKVGYLAEKNLVTPETIVVLADRPGKSLQKALANGNPIALERHLSTWLQTAQGKFLEGSPAANPMTDNLRRLIRSYRKENIEMAMVMMSRAGIPMALLSDMLAIGLFHKDEETAENGMAAFMQLAIPSLGKFVARQCQIHKNSEGEYDDEALLHALKRNPNLDIGTLVSAAMELKGKRMKLLMILPEQDRLPHLIQQLSEGQLNLSGLGLEAFPSGLETIKGLKYLMLSRNELQQLPADLSPFAPIEMLDLAENHLLELPESIGALKALKGLDLSQNRLHGLPASIGELNSLEALRLDRNPLQQLPNEISRLEKLELLGCYGCKFPVLPEIVWKMQQLRSLDLGECNLKALPHELEGFAHLESLGLRDNPIEVLPGWLGTLPALRFLDLSHLTVRTLPDTFMHHAKVERIYLIRDTSMDWEQVLPILASMPRLRYVFLRGKRIVRQMQLLIEEKVPQARVMWNG